MQVRTGNAASGAAEAQAIAGLNVLRVMRKAEAVAARLQKERPPSDARIEEVDKTVPK